MKKLQHVISYEPDRQNDIWYVKGGRWEGRVMRPKRARAFICDCLQYAKYHTCWHIRAVRDELEKRENGYYRR